MNQVNFLHQLVFAFVEHQENEENIEPDGESLSDESESLPVILVFHGHELIRRITQSFDKSPRSRNEVACN